MRKMSLRSRVVALEEIVQRQQEQIIQLRQDVKHSKPNIEEMKKCVRKAFAQSGNYIGG